MSCSGKCDGLSVKNLMRDPSELSLDDLVTVAAPKVFDALSDALSTDHVGLTLQTPRFHDTAAVEALQTGLAARYGERELSTEVNRVRAAHLAGSDDTLYAEVELTVDGNLSDGWSMNVEGLTDTTTSVGFGAGVSVEGRVITAVDFPADDPLRHVDAVRGFAIPTTAEDFRAMKPGDLVALRGKGRLGLNVGARALEIQFTIDASNRPMYKDATARSIAQARAQAAAAMFDDLRQDADEFDPHEEQLVAYGLLALAPVEHLDLRVDIDHMTKDTLATTRKVYRWAEYPDHIEAYARGPKTDPIDGGLFDIDALLRD